MHPLEQHIEQELESMRSKQFFVACSGGVDSLSLVHALHQLNLAPSAIHVNYQLRGSDSDKDEECVRAFCKKLGIPCEVRTINLAEQLKDGGNLQEAARDVRYSWFRELTNDSNNTVLLAHHRDDQVETFFLNLARKSGVMGLAAMPFENNGIVRPLLTITKDEIVAYALDKQIPWREDASNASNKYRRNLLRNQLLPEIAKTIPDIDESVLVLVNAFQETQRVLEAKISGVIQHILKDEQLSIEVYSEMTTVEKIEFARQLGKSARIVPELDKLVNAQKGKHIVLKNDSFEAIVRGEDSFEFIRIESSIPQLIIEHAESLPSTFDKNVIFIDANKLDGELKVRPWQMGDRMEPIGVSGSTLISDIVSDAKLSAKEKYRVIVVHDDSHIHWCAGLKIGRRAIATTQTTHLLKCSLSD